MVGTAGDTRDLDCGRDVVDFFPDTVSGGAGSILLPLPCFVRSDSEHTRRRPPFEAVELLCLSFTPVELRGSALGGLLTGVANP